MTRDQNDTITTSSGLRGIHLLEVIILIAAVLAIMLGNVTTAEATDYMTNVERWCTNTRLDTGIGSTLTVSDSIDGITDTYGIDPVSILEADGSTTVTVNSSTYTYWKVVLQGGDYGTHQTSASGNGSTAWTSSTEEVYRLRVMSNGTLQYIGTSTGGNWVDVDTANGYLVFYYFQQTSLYDSDDETSSIGDLLLSDWYASSFTQKVRYGIRVEVAEDDEVLWTSDAMYYWTHDGVDVIDTQLSSLSGYEIVDVEFYEADVQPNNTSGNNSQAFSSASHTGDNATPFVTYTGDDIHSMATYWDTGDNPVVRTSTNSYDPNYVVIRINVRKTGSVGLTKTLDSSASAYSDSTFTFDATVTQSGTTTVDWADSYAVYNTTTGETTYIEGVVYTDSDGTEHMLIPSISVPAGETVVILGLPQNATVTFDEVGCDDASDLSVFQTTYSYANTDTSATSYAIAYPWSGTYSESSYSGSCTVTNAESTGTGQLVITKTFTNLDELTDTERYQLSETFRIVPDDASFPTLTIDSATSSDGSIFDDDEATYTWALSSLTADQVVDLTEKGYEISGTNVVTTTKVAENDGAFSDTAEVTVSETSQTVQFVNDYAPDTATVTLTKEWGDTVTDSDEGDVVAYLYAVSSDDSSQRILVGTYTLTSSDSWTITETLPTHNGALGDLTYTAEEYSIGGELVADTDFESSVATTTTTSDDATTIAVTITNDLMPYLCIYKYYTDSDGVQQPLSGATFTLTQLTDASGDEVSSATSTTLTSDTDGYTGLTSRLASGTYSLVETSAPSGYVATDSDAITLTVSDGVISVDGTTLSTATVDEETAYYVSVENTPVVSLNLYKYILTSSGEEGDALNGAVFTLTGTATDGTEVNETLTAGSGDIDSDGTTDDGYTETVTELHPGTYTITETSAPSGYDLLSDTITVRVTEDREVYVTVGSGTEQELTDSDSDGVWTIEVGDSALETLPTTGTVTASSNDRLPIIVGGLIMAAALATIAVYSRKRRWGP